MTGIYQNGVSDAASEYVRAVTAANAAEIKRDNAQVELSDAVRALNAASRNLTKATGGKVDEAIQWRVPEC